MRIFFCASYKKRKANKYLSTKYYFILFYLFIFSEFTRNSSSELLFFFYFNIYLFPRFAKIDDGSMSSSVIKYGETTKAILVFFIEQKMQWKSLFIKQVYWMMKKEKNKTENSWLGKMSLSKKSIRNTRSVWLVLLCYAYFLFLVTAIGNFRASVLNWMKKLQF